MGDDDMAHELLAHVERQAEETARRWGVEAARMMSLIARLEAAVRGYREQHCESPDYRCARCTATDELLEKVRDPS